MQRADQGPIKCVMILLAFTLACYIVYRPLNLNRCSQTFFLQESDDILTEVSIIIYIPRKMTADGSNYRQSPDGNWVGNKQRISKRLDLLNDVK